MGFTVAALAILSGSGAGAQELPVLHSRAVELGFSTALSAVSGDTRISIGLRGGTFVGAPGGLASIEAETMYSHVFDRDELAFEGMLSWVPRLGRVHPHLGVAAGVREEWIGSFRDARYPVGFTVGMRALVSQTAGLRAEYRFRRLLDDPAANFTEHQVVIGFSLFWNNG